ncbi:MAG: T9SS type A sorting domain-containing protein [Bacteroidetes bacterium]|nr:T9SS type A sorting domain-containing protein [Bacteroidota bacterium]
MSYKPFLLSFFLITFLFISGYCQSWEPEWGAGNTQKDANTWSNVLGIDFQNNIYSGTQFGDSIFIGDTLFTNSFSYYYDWGNWAIAKYNNNGEFVTAFDLTSSLYTDISNVVLATDIDLNIYIACEYRYLVNILDTTIYSGTDSLLGAPEVFIAKLSPSLKIEWIRAIHSTSQDVCNDIVVTSDGFLYVPVKHYGSGYQTDTVNYFNQDSAIYGYTLCSLLKMDLDGNLVWRRELTSPGPSIDMRELNIDSEGNILIVGQVRDEIYFSGDTIVHPHTGENVSLPYILEIDQSGNLISGIIPDWQMYFSDTDIDEYGNFYLAGGIWDTIVFGSDTINKHEDSTVNIIAKLNSNFEPIWYETIKVISSQESYNFHIDLLSDSLFFAVRCKATFSIFDTVFYLGPRYKAFIGQLTPEGELFKYGLVESTNGLSPTSFMLDNCNNIIISGKFVGQAYFQNDTIQANSNSAFDGITAKVNRHSCCEFDFGSDTVVCDGLTLYGPDGFTNYYWNDSLTTQNWFDISESGKYIMVCNNDNGCWVTDSIYVDVQVGFDISIGQDTVITMNNTLILSVPDVYDGYLWSTGSTDNSIQVTGDSFGLGDWNIWAQVTQGVCTAFDTINLSVIDAISEFQSIGVIVYPNPVTDRLFLISEKKIEKFEIVDYQGRIIIARTNQDYMSSPVQINLSNIQSGVYFIRLYFEDVAAIGKIIKL